MKTKKLLVVGIIILFMGTYLIPAIAQNTEKLYQSVSRGNWLYVGGSGQGNYTRIQNAIDNASDGDTVFVYDASSPYYENIIVDTSICLFGENKNTTIIDGVNGGDVISVQADGVIINEFSIQYHCTYPSSDIAIQANHTTISQTIMSSSNWFGISLLNSCYTTIIKNYISNKYVGISLNAFSSYNTISGNDLTNNSYGLELKSSSFNHINHNNFLFNIYNAYDNCSNHWNESYPFGGNYWSDYTGFDYYHGPNQDILGSDGLGDTPYDLPCEHAMDWYPFMEPNGWNQPPNPPIFTGPLWGIKNVNYTFCITWYNPDGDDFYCLWDWGDGNTTEWLGPFFAGQPICTSHAWSQTGIYEIQVKIKDIYGVEIPSTPYLFHVYELKKAFIFGRFKNLTEEGEYISIQAFNLWIIFFRPLQFLHYTNWEIVMLLQNTIKLMIIPQFIMGLSEVVT